MLTLTLTCAMAWDGSSALLPSKSAVMARSNRCFMALYRSGDAPTLAIGQVLSAVNANSYN